MALGRRTRARAWLAVVGSGALLPIRAAAGSPAPQRAAAVVPLPGAAAEANARQVGSPQLAEPAAGTDPLPESGRPAAEATRPSARASSQQVAGRAASGAVRGSTGAVRSAGAEGAAQGESRGAGPGGAPFRPHGAVEFGIGLLVLPDAEVCADSTCSRGDVSLEVEARPLFRVSERFAVGAGITLGLTPTAPPQRPTRFEREHSRRYLLAEGVGRYYFLRRRSIQLWTGAVAGLVVVSDNFRSPGSTSEFSVAGSSSANLVTEGLTLGLELGALTEVSRSVALGAAFKAANWLLPSEPSSSPVGDETSLLGRNTMVSLALSVAYHRP